MGLLAVTQMETDWSNSSYPNISSISDSSVHPNMIRASSAKPNSNWTSKKIKDAKVKEPEINHSYVEN